MKARGENRATDACILRQPRPGDLGWVVHRHGVVYREEYGRDVQFEGFVAGIVAKFIQRHDAKRERCWMAEMNGEIIGSAFIVKRFRKGVPTSTYAGREKSSRTRIRHSFGEPVYMVLTSGWLPEDHLIDRKPPSGGSTHLRESRFSTGPRGTPTQLRA